MKKYESIYSTCNCNICGFEKLKEDMYKAKLLGEEIYKFAKDMGFFKEGKGKMRKIFFIKYRKFIEIELQDVYKVTKISNKVEFGEWSNKQVYMNKNIISYYAIEHNSYTNDHFNFVLEVIKDAELAYICKDGCLMMVKQYQIIQKRKKQFVEVKINSRNNCNLFHFGPRTYNQIINNFNKEKEIVLIDNIIHLL